MNRDPVVISCSQVSANSFGDQAPINFTNLFGNPKQHTEILQYNSGLSFKSARVDRDSGYDDLIPLFLN